MDIIYNDLAIAVKQAFQEVKKDEGISPTFFGKQVAEPMGLSVTSIAEYTRGYEKGSIYGSCSRNPMDLKGRLDKTSVFLHPLKFSEKYPEVLAGIKERDERFVYLPPEDKRVSYEKIIEEFELIKNNNDNNKRDKQPALVYLEFGMAVTERFEKNGVSQRFWAKELAPVLNMPISTVEHYITQWKQGYLHATKIPKDPDIQLVRLGGLSIFLYSIDFPKDDEIIDGIREMTLFEFIYPPPEEKNRVSYGEIIEKFEAFRKDTAMFNWS